MLLKVLYLDDEPDLCEIFFDEFSSEEIQILTYTDFQKAIDSAKKNPPDVIFVDFRLPRTNGDLVAQAMPGQIPKYLITGEASPATDYKFAGVFGKPFDAHAIRETMSQLITQKKTA